VWQYETQFCSYVTLSSSLPSFFVWFARVEGIPTERETLIAKPITETRQRPSYARERVFPQHLSLSFDQPTPAIQLFSSAERIITVYEQARKETKKILYEYLVVSVRMTL
jgi:hypothetical protein